MKKVLAFILAVIIMTGILYIPAQAESSPSGKWTDAGNYDLPVLSEDEITYIISTAKQLAGLAVLTESEPGKVIDKNIVLMNDIDLSAHYWVPVGTVDKPFKSSFNGGGNKISGMIIHDYYTYAGLIGYCGKGDISNVIIENAEISFTNENDSAANVCVGCVVGYNEENVIGCSVRYCDIDVTAYGNVSVGSIVGNNGSVRYCNAYNCTVSSKAKVAQSYAGGIIGNTNNTATGCIADSCTVTAQSPNNTYSGGIAGDIAHCNGCAASNCIVSTQAENYGYSGGAFGNSRNDVKNAAVINCNVSITSTAKTEENASIYVGGFAGSTDAVDACYSDAEVTFTDAYSTVSAASYVANMRGDAYGYINSEKAGTLPAYCIKTGNITIIEKTTDYIKSEMFADVLNNYWTNDADADNDGNSVWDFYEESENSYTSYPIPYPPYIDYVIVTPPDYCGGSAVIHVIGTNLGYAKKIIIGNNNRYYSVNTDTLAVEIPSSTKWSVFGDSNDYSEYYSYLVYLNNLNNGYCLTKSGTFTLNQDNPETPAEINTLSYIPQATGDGSLIDVFINGANLNTTVKSIELYAEILDAENKIIFRAPAVIKRTGSNVVATVALPKNITSSALTYTLNAYLQGVLVEFDTQQTLVIEPYTGTDGGTVSCDINNDGVLNMLDIVRLTRIIIEKD